MDKVLAADAAVPFLAPKVRKGLRDELDKHLESKTPVKKLPWHYLCCGAPAVSTVSAASTACSRYPHGVAGAEMSGDFRVRLLVTAVPS